MRDRGHVPMRRTDEWFGVYFLCYNECFSFAVGSSFTRKLVKNTYNKMLIKEIKGNNEGDSREKL